MKNKKGTAALLILVVLSIIPMAVMGSHYKPKTVDTVENPGPSPFVTQPVGTLEETTAGGVQ
jgi:hypothetical protein